MATRFPFQREDGAASFTSLLSPSPLKLLFPGFAGYLGSRHRAKSSSVKGWKEVVGASTALTSPCSFEGDGRGSPSHPLLLGSAHLAPCQETVALSLVFLEGSG